MTFEEALIRARAAHVKVEEWHQPGNDYRTEYVCKQKCGRFGSVFAENWEQHIIDAADRLMAEGLILNAEKPLSSVREQA